MLSKVSETIFVVGYCLVLMVVYYTLLLISADIVRTDLGKYSMLDEMVSTLGNRGVNPRGYKLFNAAMWVFGIGSLPMMMIIYNKFSLTQVGLSSYVFMCIGLLFVIGLTFWDERHPKHFYVAMGAFIAFGIGFILLLVHTYLVRFFDIYLLIIMVILILLIIIFGIYSKLKVNMAYVEWIAILGLQLFMMLGGGRLCLI